MRNIFNTTHKQAEFDSQNYLWLKPLLFRYYNFALPENGILTTILSVIGSSAMARERSASLINELTLDRALLQVRELEIINAPGIHDVYRDELTHAATNLRGSLNIQNNTWEPILADRPVVTATGRTRILSCQCSVNPNCRSPHVRLQIPSTTIPTGHDISVAMSNAGLNAENSSYAAVRFQDITRIEAHCRIHCSLGRIASLNYCYSQHLRTERRLASVNSILGAPLGHFVGGVFCTYLVATLLKNAPIISIPAQVPVQVSPAPIILGVGPGVGQHSTVVQGAARLAARTIGTALLSTLLQAAGLRYILSVLSPL